MKFKATLSAALVGIALLSTQSTLAEEQSAESCKAKECTCTAPAPEPVDPNAPLWKGQIALGYGSSGGNAVTESLTAGINIQRWNDGSKAIFGTKITYGEYKHEATQNIGQAAAIYREDFGDSKKFGDSLLYWGTGLIGMYDEMSHLHYRVAGLVGVGIHALKGPIVMSDFEFGPGMEAEDDLLESREYAIYRIANYTAINFSKTASFEMDTNYQQSFENVDDWMINIEPGFMTQITKVVGLKLGGWYRYEKTPSFEAKKKDWIFGAQVAINF